MRDPPRLYFVIPAFNEEQDLPGLFASLDAWRRERNRAVEVIVVDDGSTDATAAVVRQYADFPALLVQHPMHRGVHVAFATGFRAVLERSPHDEDLVVTLEADNTSSLVILERMVEEARRGHDLILASCYAPGGEVVRTQIYRRLLSWIANALLRTIPAMPRVHTFSSFYRVQRAALLRRLVAAYGDRLIELEGFVCVVELLYKSAGIGAAIAEVPMVLDAAARRGTSKMRILPTMWGYLRLCARVLVGRLARPRPAGVPPVAVGPMPPAAPRWGK